MPRPEDSEGASMTAPGSGDAEPPSPGSGGGADPVGPVPGRSIEPAALSPGAPDLASPDPAHFRRVFGHLPTGVTVVTAIEDGEPVGMAANSVTSVSLDPPLLLICPARSSTTWPHVRAAGGFCVNVLAHDHEALSRRFAAADVDRFAGVSWHPRQGGPALDDAIAWIDCRIEAEHDAGDHTIAVCRVLALDLTEGFSPLVFFGGRYGTFAPHEVVGDSS